MMRQVITKDGSATFHNAQYGEYYHSLTGAMEEAVKKYAEPCRIAELAKKGNIAILDVCFGLGYNSAAAIDAALSSDPGCRINIVCLENDQCILDETKEVDIGFKSYNLIREAATKHHAEHGNISIRLLYGDAKEKIKEIKSISFDVVFLDPFSPKRCPELWTEEFFKDIYSLMKKGGILATYSCARHIRENLQKAGFRVMDGPCIGRNAPSTLAFK